MLAKPLSPMGGRIHDGMIARGINSARDLAHRANVPHQTLHRWMHEEVRVLDPIMLLRVVDTVGLSLTWILSGEGSPLKRLIVSPQETELVESFRSLTPKRREVVMRCISDLLPTT